ncbi:MAG TPA: tRNA pseudouridine(38-40) synthase TruA [Stellaceae bacterium]|jgi:tRNA pseudouridine38-40 synthase|nr:tRNA pseudouridine(38-40) synthase TruA [Stellaceae bacterium]
MPRYKLLLEYDGTALHGWQRQANGLSVQEVLEIAVERFCGQKLVVHGAGRTDAGVHALGQTAHVDLPKEMPTDVIRNALNQHVKPHAVSIISVEPVAANFDARRSARGRVYCYRILNRRAPAAVLRGHVWHVGVPLDVEAMQQGAALLLGKHDFTTFRDSECQANSPVKTLDRLTVTRVGDEVQVEARARSFLHHQVRNMVGTLKLVGAGKWRAQRVGEALEARDRRAGGPTAPPDGLYLVEVVYPE